MFHQYHSRERLCVTFPAEVVRIQRQVAVLSPGSGERLLQVELYRGYKWDLIRISKRKHKAITESTTGQPSSAADPQFKLVLGVLEILNSGVVLLLFSVVFPPSSFRSLHVSLYIKHKFLVDEKK